MRYSSNNLKLSILEILSKIISIGEKYLGDIANSFYLIMFTTTSNALTIMFV